SPNFEFSFLSDGGKGPAVVIANYVFDSLPQDAFIISDGTLLESLVTTKQAPPGTGTPPIEPTPISSFQRSFRNFEISVDRYPDPAWNRILDYYRRTLPNATVLFPSAALQTLQHLVTQSDGRMLILAADKGLSHEEDLPLCQEPAFEFHHPN